ATTTGTVPAALSSRRGGTWPPRLRTRAATRSRHARSASVDLRTVPELMGHKTLAMTLRYAPLAPAPAPRRPAGQPGGDAPRSDTRTDTSEPPAKVAATGGAEVRALPSDSSGGARNRTGDLGIMSRPRPRTPVHSSPLQRKRTGG